MIDARACSESISAFPVWSWSVYKMGTGKFHFDAIEYSTNNSRMEIVCGNCRGVICWWPINIEQISTLDESKNKVKPLTVPTRTDSADYLSCNHPYGGGR